MSKEGNLSSLYSSLVHYFQEHENEDNPISRRLLDELYDSLVNGNQSSIWGGDVFIGEEVQQESITYMHVRR